jgi:hypothetical protein
VKAACDPTLEAYKVKNWFPKFAFIKWVNLYRCTARLGYLVAALAILSHLFWLPATPKKTLGWASWAGAVGAAEEVASAAARSDAGATATTTGAPTMAAGATAGAAGTAATAAASSAAVSEYAILTMYTVGPRPSNAVECDPDPPLESARFQPSSAYEVKTWFQSLLSRLSAFKLSTCNRYDADNIAVGLCTLNQVDP